VLVCLRVCVLREVCELSVCACVSCVVRGCVCVCSRVV